LQWVHGIRIRARDFRLLLKKILLSTSSRYRVDRAKLWIIELELPRGLRFARPYWALAVNLRNQDFRGLEAASLARSGGTTRACSMVG
jgi:hypothetical protein